MKLLLDTHIVLWALNDPPALGERAGALVIDPDNDVFVSIASLWEIAIKTAIGKLKADIGSVDAALSATPFAILPIEVRHLVGLTSLPMHHRDPFDRLLIAQAIVDGLTLLSEDENVPLYGVPYMTRSG